MYIRLLFSSLVFITSIVSLSVQAQASVQTQPRVTARPQALSTSQPQASAQEQASVRAQPQASAQPQAPSQTQAQASPPHQHLLEVDLNSQELRARLHKQNFMRILNGDFVIQDEPSIEEGLRVGERLLQWVELINAQRSDDQKIRLTSPEHRTSYPIDKPNHYSPRTVAAAMQAAKDVMPLEMKTVLFSEQESLPNQNPISDDAFILSGRAIDRVYQTAARWQMLSPNKFYYISNRIRDIRGYYFLNAGQWNAETLAGWVNISPEVQAQIREAFIGICVNNRVSLIRCTQLGNGVATANQAVALYNQYINKARKTYNGFFDISGNRRDISWTRATPNIASIPFVMPTRTGADYFVQHNIEDEYSWQQWGLKINFINHGSAPYIKFVPGVTAHVDGLGGNKIEMDANKSLDEYEEQWTIRHEFGHVLGFPDCYQEFYDEANEEFINYQLDVTDLMCSRAGNFNERMYNQLRAAYMR